MTTKESSLLRRFEDARRDLGKLVYNKAIQASQLLDKRPYLTEHAPDSLATMRLAWEQPGKTYPIFRGASDKTIYQVPYHNMCFRFWHDILHIVYSLDVSFEEELTLSALHQDAAEFWYGPDAALLMRIDTRCQSEYYKEHGVFPEDQLAFAWAKWQSMA